MKKLTAMLLCLAMLFAFAGCGSKDTGSGSNAGTAKKGVTEDVLPRLDIKSDVTVPDDFKIGMICLHDENSTYDNNFIQALKSVQKGMGLKDEQVVIVTGIGEDSKCYDAAVDLAKNKGCKVIFADSFGHESFMKQAAKEFPNVQFCHATGTSGKIAGIANFHNAFASIYEGRYLAGIAAGMKLNEMIKAGKIKAEEAVIGYVGAYTYAEVISGMTSFFLGAPTACELAGVPNVSYNGSTYSAGKNTFIVSSAINWAPYFQYIIECAVKGQAIDSDWCGDIATNSVVISGLNQGVAAEGTEAKLKEAIDAFKAGTLKVFATDKFTVDGKKLDQYMADIDGDFKGDTNVIHDGYFDESNAKSFRSAPYFDIIIDGVTNLNKEV